MHTGMDFMISCTPQYFGERAFDQILWGRAQSFRAVATPPKEWQLSHADFMSL